MIINNANDPSYPARWPNGSGQPEMTCFGLTKRELFAAMAMQGLLSNLAEIRRAGFSDRDIEMFAVIRADALLAQLAKGADDE